MKTVKIIFAETGGKGFNCYIEGVDSERLSQIPEEEWSPAEFWGMKMFNVVIAQMKQVGIVHSSYPKPRVN